MNKWSLIYHAAWGGHAHTVRALIDHGASVAAKDRWGRSPLCWACCREQVEVASILLGAGAPPNGNLRPQLAHLQRHGHSWASPMHLALRGADGVESSAGEDNCGGRDGSAGGEGNRGGDGGVEDSESNWESNWESNCGGGGSGGSGGS